MSEEEIAATNARLADPPDLDVAVTRRMGLYVVARLAKRHNVTVRLRDNEDIEGGLIARINVPADLIAPIGAPQRGGLPGPATSGSLGALGEATSTDSRLNALGSTGANAPSRNSGIAGAFTGGMPRLRPDGGPTGATHGGQDTSQDRTAAEVASYPPFQPPGYEAGPAAPPNGVPAQPAPPPAEQQNGRHNTGQSVEDTGTALFGAPLPEAPVNYDQPTGYTAYSGSTPATPPSSADIDAPTERLPIYEAVLSQWFEAADTGSAQAVPADAGMPVENGHNGHNGSGNGHATAAAPETTEVPVQEPTSWTSPGDDGWLAAQALLSEEKAPISNTTAGLPKRVPKAHLVPGSAAPRHEAKESAGETTQTGLQLPPRSADAVRGRMSSFQQGVRRGRHALIDAYAGDQSGSEHSREDEEQE
jgi:hypothetical protein